MSNKKITKKKVSKGKKVKASKTRKKVKKTPKKTAKYETVFHFVYWPKKTVMEFKMLRDDDGYFRVYSRARDEKLWAFETESKRGIIAYNRMISRMAKYTPIQLLKSA